MARKTARPGILEVGPEFPPDCSFKQLGGFLEGTPVQKHLMAGGWIVPHSWPCRIQKLPKDIVVFMVFNSTRDPFGGKVTSSSCYLVWATPLVSARTGKLMAEISGPVILSRVNPSLDNLPRGWAVEKTNLVELSISIENPHVERPNVASLGVIASREMNTRTRDCWANHRMEPRTLGAHNSTVKGCIITHVFPEYGTFLGIQVDPAIGPRLEVENISVKKLFS